MSEIKFTMDLQWKDFKVCMESIESWVKANAGPSYVGNSADSDITLNFTSVPDSAIVELIQSHWDSLDKTSIEATSYKSAEQKMQDDNVTKSKLLASASAKLAALGLSIDEIKALIS